MYAANPQEFPPKESSGIYQPIYSTMIDVESMKELYATEYVERNSFDPTGAWEAFF
jgi:hypothetical protein